MNPAPTEADAFVQGILAHPEDRVRRLVFADWLEERGTESNVAWAGYLRAQAECEFLHDDRPRVSELLARAESYRPAIQARLKLPARAVRSSFLHLVQLLPPANVQTQLADFEMPRDIDVVMGESVARETSAVIVGCERRCYALATPYPRSRDNLSRLRQYFYRETVVLFFGKTNEVTNVINLVHGEPFWETADRSSYEPPWIGLEGQELVDLFSDIFWGQFTSISVFLGEDRAWTLLYHTDEPTGGRSISRQAYYRLLDHLLSLDVEAEAITEGAAARRANQDMRVFGMFDSIPFADGVVTRQVNSTLLGGRRCRTSFQYVVGGRPIRWFRVDFPRS